MRSDHRARPVHYLNAVGGYKAKNTYIRSMTMSSNPIKIRLLK